MDDDLHQHTAAPLWLRLLMLGVAVWVGVRIVQNTTESLSGMAHGGATIPVHRLQPIVR